MTVRTLTKVAERLNRRYRRQYGCDLPPLLMLTDERRLPDPLGSLARLPRGSAVILRHYGVGPRERTLLAQALRRETASFGLSLLIAGDPVLARMVAADGLHVPEHAIGRLALWRRTAGASIVTAAAHSPAAIARAAREGADAVLLSPIFPTRSHPHAREVGPARAGLWLARARLPVYALGGVSHETAPLLLPFPFAGLAAVGAFAGSQS